MRSTLKKLVPRRLRPMARKVFYLPAEAENYLSEISRVLKPGGRCFATFFLLNEESLKHLEAGESRMSFGYDFGDYRVKEKNTPEAAIAFHEKHGLGIEAPIHYGSWCGRGEHLDFQDVIISSKPGSH